MSDTNTNININTDGTNINTKTYGKCPDIKCVDDLIKHIIDKKRKIDLYRKILELKYNRYKNCHNAWGISTILLSTALTFIESWKLIFIDEGNSQVANDFFDLTPIFMGSIITCTASILKFKKYQEKMESHSNIIEKCIGMTSKLKNKKETYIVQKNCSTKIFDDLLVTYNDDILTEYFLIYQESQKYIKNTDYDKYAKLINNSELHKFIIERDRLKFYEKYDEYDNENDLDMNKKIKEIEKCYKYKCCCCNKL